MNENLAQSLTEKLAAVPGEPGVYLYRDTHGEVIYVGKAKNLKNRVRSYFQDSRERDPKTEKLVTQIRDLEFIVTASEYEAFLLESNLIHQHRPLYNIFLKDDKSFPFICLAVQEAFPRISLTRRPVKDGARYFGPFIPAASARRLIDLVRKCFGVRTCRKEIGGNRRTPCCLDYHIHLCLAPCVAELCPPERYRQAVEEAVLFLEGKDRELQGRLAAEMEQASTELRFEEAALLRDRLEAVRSLAETQRMVRPGEDEADIFAYYHRDDRVAVQVFHFRRGKVVDRRQLFWEGLAGFEPVSFLSELLPQFYLGQLVIPLRVVLPVELPEVATLQRWLTEKRGAKVAMVHPVRGTWARLVELASTNARHAYATRFRASEAASAAPAAVQEALGLDRLPRRIEAFDISNTQGREAVASLVAAEDGRLKRSDYRRFKIRTTEGEPDDFASMREVITRRFSRLLQEGRPLPDLAMVDGGAGQVSAALVALTSLGLEGQVALCGLAKRDEEIYLPERTKPVRLPRTSPALKLLQQLRDEAHRFAVTYHRRRRQATSFASQLDGISGIGPTRKKQLLKHFRSLEKLQQATLEQLEEVVGKRTGRSLFEHLHRAAP